MDDFFLFSVSLGITLLGLAGSWGAYRRRGAASAMRGTAWSLVPMAAYLTGLTAWATDLVFSPVKWAGMALLGLAGVLYMVSGVLLRRGAGSAEAERTADGQAAAPKGERSRGKGALERRQAPDVDPDLADIENILRRRGIS
jgi:hypothetical protein